MSPDGGNSFSDHVLSTVILRSFDLHFCQLSGFSNVQETHTAKTAVSSFTCLEIVSFPVLNSTLVQSEILFVGSLLNIRAAKEEKGEEKKKERETAEYWP